jgi:hypothetical protein
VACVSSLKLQSYAGVTLRHRDDFFEIGVKVCVLGSEVFVEA